MPIPNAIIPKEIENPDTKYWNDLQAQVQAETHAQLMDALEHAEEWFQAQDKINGKDHSEIRRKLNENAVKLG